MKYIVLLIITFFSAIVVYSQTNTAEADFKKLDWLQGVWNRVNTKPGRSGHERWEKISPVEWRGFGVSMTGKDTTFIEKIKLFIKEGNIYYVADVAQNKAPVYFKLTEITATGFVCENPEHDFPKKIAYQKEGAKLKATISGDGKSIDYWFEGQ